MVVVVGVGRSRVFLGGLVFFARGWWPRGAVSLRRGRRTPDFCPSLRFFFLALAPIRSLLLTCTRGLASCPHRSQTSTVSLTLAWGAGAGASLAVSPPAAAFFFLTSRSIASGRFQELTRVADGYIDGVKCRAGRARCRRAGARAHVVFDLSFGGASAPPHALARAFWRCVSDYCFEVQNLNYKGRLLAGSCHQRFRACL